MKNLFTKAVKTVKDVVVDTVVAAQAQAELKNRFVWFPEYVTIGGIKVIHDQVTLDAFGLKVAAVVCFQDGRKQIFVGDDFFTLSASAQYAFIMHEQAHIELNHDFKKQKRTLAKLKGEVCPMELEADHYAALTVGKEVMRMALEELDLMLDQKEIRQRIAALS